MTIGIGGAGCKLAVKLDPDGVAVNVSESELNKVEAARRLLAVVHTARGQFRGSRKNPQIGRDAYQSVKRELLNLCRGNTLVASTGGGTGNGITSALLKDLAGLDDIPPQEKTTFVLVLPYAKLEPAEYVRNTIDFLRNTLSEAIDTGNTGNIFLVSNRVKFEERLAEDAYNERIVESLREFLAIPRKSDELLLLDGHIDYEDFDLYLSRPFFNHFTAFDYDPGAPFAEQLAAATNPLLLPPEAPIEALFFLEVPSGADPTCYYDILEYFSGNSVSPVFSVVRNPARERPFLTVSLLYSRKPTELLEDFARVSEAYTKAKVSKSIEQHVELPRLEVSLEDTARKAAKAHGSSDADILAVLKRLGKL